MNNLNNGCQSEQRGCPWGRKCRSPPQTSPLGFNTPSHSCVTETLNSTHLKLSSQSCLPHLVFCKCSLSHPVAQARNLEIAQHLSFLPIAHPIQYAQVRKSSALDFLSQITLIHFSPFASLHCSHLTQLLLLWTTTADQVVPVLWGWRTKFSMQSKVPDIMQPLIPSGTHLQNIQCAFPPHGSYPCSPFI